MSNSAPRKNGSGWVAVAGSDGGCHFCAASRWASRTSALLSHLNYTTAPVASVVTIPPSNHLKCQDFSEKPNGIMYLYTLKFIGGIAKGSFEKF